MTNKPNVSLISYTPHPIEVMCYARRVMHSKVPDAIESLMSNPKHWLDMSIDDYFKNVCLKDGMPTFLEYVNFVFKLENVSRALQQQLTRHRIGFSFSIQSLRCVNLPTFADDGAYYNPFPKDSLEYKNYHDHMIAAQSTYNYALRDGVNTQDARGFLPMNIHSTITFSCTLRALVDMVNKRLCLKTQEEFREVAHQIVEEVKWVNKRMGVLFMKPCDKGRCIMQGENEQQLFDGKLTGRQNTDHVCPVFIEKFTKGGKLK